MNFISDKLQQYIDDHSMEESDLLKALDRETHQKVLQPRMLSGSYQGRLLALLSKMIGPKKDPRGWNLHWLCYFVYG